MDGPLQLAAGVRCGLMLAARDAVQVTRFAGTARGSTAWVGRPEDCLDQLRGFVEAGCRHVVLAPMGDPEEFAQRVADEMIEEIRGLG